MALNYAAAVKILQSRIADSSDDEGVKHALDQAQREVMRSRPWPEATARLFFNTEAAYTTGTVAVTNGSTTVTLTGGVWPATVASGKYRFALSVTSPWYEVLTRTSDTVIVLKDAYVQDTSASETYVAYKSHYTLGATVDRVEMAWLHQAGSAPPLENAATDQMVTEFLHYPSGPGVPTHYRNIERTSLGKRQILLGPATPDEVYRVEYSFRKKSIDGTFSGNLDETRWPVILARASAILYEPEFYDRHLKSQAMYERLLKKEWANENESETQYIRVGANRVRYPLRDAYLENIMRYGCVESPT